MIEERHAYGTSLGCIGRRIFVLLFCSIMSVLCIIHIIYWISQWGFIKYLRTGSGPEMALGCAGNQCYEVFTCFGMKDTSQNLREPLTTLAGVIAFPLGVVGSHVGSLRYLHVLYTYLFVSALLHIGLIIYDAIFLKTCDMYSGNIVQQMFLQVLRLPPSLISSQARSQLQALQSYPVVQVDSITGGFDVTTWYFVVESIWAVFLGYVAHESYRLSQIVERGPLGLGVHFGLNQWDEMINHEAVRRAKGRQIPSKFIDDAQLPVQEHDGADMEAISGYLASSKRYGTTTAPGYQQHAYGNEAHYRQESYHPDFVAEAEAARLAAKLEWPPRAHAQASAR